MYLLLPINKTWRCVEHARSNMVSLKSGRLISSRDGEDGVNVSMSAAIGFYLVYYIYIPLLQTSGVFSFVFSGLEFSTIALQHLVDSSSEVLISMINLQAGPRNQPPIDKAKLASSYQLQSGNQIMRGTFPTSQEVSEAPVLILKSAKK